MCPQHIIQYNLPTEKDDLQTALDAVKWKEVVEGVQYFIAEYRHAHKEDYVHMDDVENEINRLMLEKRL